MQSVLRRCLHGRVPIDLLEDAVRIIPCSRFYATVCMGGYQQHRVVGHGSAYHAVGLTPLSAWAGTSKWLLEDAVRIIPCSRFYATVCMGGYQLTCSKTPCALYHAVGFTPLSAWAGTN